MPKLATPLTDTFVRSIKRDDYGKTFADGNGLYLEVSLAGTKAWMVRYRLPDGKGRRVVIGQYPDMSLKDARNRADEIHAHARAGAPVIGVRVAKRLERAQKTLEEIEQERLDAQAKARSFTVVSEAWLAQYKPSVVASTFNKARLIIRSYLQPAFGQADIATLSRIDVAPVIEDMARRVPGLAQKVPGITNQIIDYAIHKRMRAEYTELNLSKATRKIPKGNNHPAILDEEGLGKLIRDCRGYQNRVISNALMFCAWTASRPATVASARWDEINLVSAEWTIPGERMKTRQTHVVPLPRQAVGMLKEMHKITGGTEYVFPAVGKITNPHLGRDSLSRALRLMGYQGRHTTHGFRASFRTLARERLEVDSEVLEEQLAHTKRGANGTSYDRTAFTKQRIKVVQLWADYLDEIARGVKVVPSQISAL